MAVMESTHFPGEAKTPICSGCNISLCWDISNDEYERYKDFWDNWECKECNSNYEGQYKRYKKTNDVTCSSGNQYKEIITEM